ncbi:hypothetical protein XENOCAPTIV_006449, partial [Xenoophorus captivus]
MLLWQPYPRTTGCPGSLLEESSPAEHMKQDNNPKHDAFSNMLQLIADKKCSCCCGSGLLTRGYLNILNSVAELGCFPFTIPGEPTFLAVHGFPTDEPKKRLAQSFPSHLDYPK